MEAMIQTVMMAQELFAKASLVDYEKLVAAQKAADIVRAEGCLQDAFATDVRPAIRAWRTIERIAGKPARGIPAKRLFGARRAGARSAQFVERRFVRIGKIIYKVMPVTTSLRHLKDLWVDATAAGLEKDQLALLRYRSNLLGADLRITNFGGGNTSSKIDLPDPFTGKTVKVLAVKGSGGDLGSIKESGFALLYQDKLESLKSIYKGEAHEDEMVAFYPLSAFGENKVAASIDTPLHGFLPFPHVDHLHPDWAIALAASANGKQKLDEFNKQYGRKIVWLPWQRPGFELGLMLAKAVADNPGCDGVLLGSHGLFTWGNTQRECYLNSVQTIDQMGEFILSNASARADCSAASNGQLWLIGKRLRLRFCRHCAESFLRTNE